VSTQAHRGTLRIHDDRGAALILAICFVVMVGAISGGLATLATSSLNNRGSLEAVRNRQYAADGAIQEAISQVRSAAVSPTSACSTVGSSATTFNAVAIHVDWRSTCGVVRAADGSVIAQRNVLFSSCPDTGSTCLDAAVIIRAQVNFEQSASGAVTRTFVQSWSVNR
jgi:Tfp pilus assembly protein PilX